MSISNEAYEYMNNKVSILYSCHSLCNFIYNNAILGCAPDIAKFLVYEVHFVYSIADIKFPLPYTYIYIYISCPNPNLVNDLHGSNCFCLL